MLNKLKADFKKSNILIHDLMDQWQKQMMKWVVTHYLQLAIFNIIMLLLVLLRSAGYFEPIFLISINFIVFSGLILSIIFLGAKSQTIFLTAAFFIMLSVPFRVFGILGVWAERTMIYAFEAILLGMVMLIIESMNSKND